jgi:hypothetical protein
VRLQIFFSHHLSVGTTKRDFKATPVVRRAREVLPHADGRGFGDGGVFGLVLKISL